MPIEAFEILKDILERTKNSFWPQCAVSVLNAVTRLDDTVVLFIAWKK